MSERNAWLAVARAVGERLGVAIEPPPAARATAHLRAIAKASRVRLREVRLAGEWWRQEAGPLVGRSAEGRPLALLPRRGGGYEAWDPEGGRRLRVDSSTAGSIAPGAWMIYRPLPAGPISVTDAFRFGLRGARLDLRRAALLGLGAGLIAFATPVVTATLLDTIVPIADSERLLVLIATFVCAAFAAALFEFAQGIAVVRIESRLSNDLQAALWDRLLRLPAAFFRRFSTGELLQRALAVQQIQQLLATVGVAALLQGVFLSISFVLLFVYDAGLALVATALTTAGSAILIVLLRRQVRLQQTIQEARGQVSRIMVQLVRGVAKLKVAGAESRAFGQWADRFARQQEAALASTRIQGRLATFIAASVPFTALVLLGAVGARQPGSTDPADLVAFLAAFAQVLAATRLIATSAGTMLQIAPLVDRARPILEARPEVDEPRADPGRLNGAIELNEVSFSYGAGLPPAVRAVSMRVEPNEFVALVGASGAGKTSVLRLILGFENPESGTVLVDDRDLKLLDVEAVRAQTGVVLQHARLLGGTILNNIVGERELTRDDAWRAAALAGLDGDIEALPMGMETIVGEGAGFSGGQRQRLLLARALASKPRLLLLDEATSALDNPTQRTVSESVAGLGLTRIVIAHRLSTIRAADRIVVMEHGEVVQRGSFEELAGVEGRFRELVRRQLA